MTKEEIQNCYDLGIAALCIWREARGEPLEGKIAVWHVILNRVADPRWPNTISEVVLQPYQFSSFNSNDANSSRWPARKDPDWIECLGVIGGESTDPTQGSNHYHAEYVHPKWARYMTKTVQIGQHIFYRS